MSSGRVRGVDMVDSMIYLATLALVEASQEEEEDDNNVNKAHPISTFHYESHSNNYISEIPSR